jgi:hypothetical protein
MFLYPISFLSSADEAFSTKSLAFDGTDDHVICGELPVTTTLTAFSFSLWVKVGSTTTRMNLTSSPYNTWNDNFAIYYEAGTTTLKVEQGASVKYENTSTTLPVGTWTHLCFVFDASESTAATKSKCYINGVSILNASAVLFVSLVDKDEDLYFGCRYLAANGSKAYFYDGNMDEASFFNIALSSGDVSDIYNLGSPTDLTGESGLVSWWRMGENSTFSSPQILMPENTNKDKFSNYSMDFDGVGDKVDVAYNSSLDVASGNHSISFWIKTTTSSTTVLTEKAATELAVWFLSSKIYWAGANAFSSATTINDGNWKHICLVADGSASYIYINGSLSATGGNKIVASTNVTAFVYGARSNGSFAYNGKLDELAIFNTALSSVNVTAIYNSGTPADLTSLSPVSWWRIEKATFSTNWTVPDETGSNDGTSANMTIEDRTGDAPDSSNNALSYNMVEADIEEEAP